MQIRDSLMHSNGTTSYETLSVILPSFFLNVLTCLFINVFGMSYNFSRRLMFEFVSIVVPIVLNITIFVEYINSILMTLLFITLISGLLFKYHKSYEVECSKQNVTDTKINFLTVSRSTINIISVVAILAVDFLIFPRRFTKTINYGYSLMDVGVGLYVFSNGIVEIRHYNNSFIKTIKNVIPLIVLGAGRFLLTKEIDYYVPVSEYGVHWNFFITLAVTKLLSSSISSFISAKNAIYSGISLLLIHEIILQLGLAKYVLSNVKRSNFFAANREGIVSSLGYIGLYYLSVAFGRYISIIYTKRTKWKCFLQLCAISGFLLWATLVLEKNFGVSRRLANSGYCIWIMFIGVFMTTLFYLAEIILNYIFKGINAVTVPLIYEAINYNGLVFFLLANIVTGLINILINTLEIGVVNGILIIFLYSLFNCGVVSFLYVKQIKIKL